MTNTDFNQKWRERATAEFYRDPATPQWVKDLVAVCLEKDPTDVVNALDVVHNFMRRRHWDAVGFDLPTNPTR